MSQLTRQRIRLAVDTSRFEQVKDVRTAAAPVLWRANDAAFEVGLFRGGDLLDVSNFSSLLLEVKGNDLAGITGTALMSQSITSGIDNTVNPASWGDESKQNALFAFTGTETNLSLDGGLEKTFYLVISGTTADSPARKVTLGFALLKIKESGVAGSGSPPTPSDLYYTAAQSDGLYARLAPSNGNYRMKNGNELQLRDTATNQWRSLWIANGVIQIGAPES